MKRFLLVSLVAFAACARREPAVATYPGAPVIVISIDTLRADRLPMFGYGGVETPNLDAFRRDAVLFTTAYSHVPLTLPSHVSILTGLLPPQNGVRNNLGYTLDAKIPTLPRFLKQHGYHTGAAVSAFVLRGTAGLSQSFDYYEDAIASRPGVPTGALQRSGRLTEQIATRWIGAHASQPLFFLFHIFEPHAPYEPEEPFRARYPDPYDGEVATADAIVGDFLRELKNRGIYDRAIIFVLSDHGEGLGQHGEPEHGIFVYRETIHVPLLVKLPGNVSGGATIGAPTGLADIFPTVAQLLGLAPPPNLSGRSLFARGPERRIYSESLYPRIHLGWSELRSLEDAQKHFIEAPKPELYDLQHDPQEKTNILSDDRRTYAAMRSELARYRDTAAAQLNVDPEEAKKLAALGYLSAPAASGSGDLPDPKDRIGEIGEMVAATKLLADRRYEEAIAAFRRIVEKNPRFTDAWNQLGTSLESAGRLAEASEIYKKTIESSPQLASEFALKRASVLLRLEQFGEAERNARFAEKWNPGDARLMLSRIDLARKNFPRAEEEARSVLGDANHRVAAEVLLAQVLAQQDRVQEALPVIESAGRDIAAERLGAIESYHFARGDILARMNRYDEAIAEFKEEIALFPMSRQTYANLYLVYRLRGQSREAEETLAAMERAIPGRATKEFAAKTARALGDLR